MVQAKGEKLVPAAIFLLRNIMTPSLLTEKQVPSYESCIGMKYMR